MENNSDVRVNKPRKTKAKKEINSTMVACQLSSQHSMEVNDPLEYCAHTQSNIHKINFTWTVHDFSFHHNTVGTVFQSPTFPADADNELKWTLKLFPKGEEEENKNFFSIYLYIVTKPSDKSKVLGKLRLSILNVKSEKTKKSTWTAAHHFLPNQGWGFKQLLPLDVVLNVANGYLLDDKLTILCEAYSVTDRFKVCVQKSMGQFKDPKGELADDFGTLFKNKKLSDVILVVDKHEFQAHKAVLAARSAVFAAMFEHEMEENKLNRVTITDVDHEVLEEMLRFIYTGAVPNLKEMPHHLLALADKYALKKLKSMAEESLFGALSIETAAETLVLADLHSAYELKQKTIKFININAKDIIKSKGWATMKNQNAHSLLIAETFEALFTPPT